MIGMTMIRMSVRGSRRIWMNSLRMMEEGAASRCLLFKNPVQEDIHEVVDGVQPTFRAAWTGPESFR